MSTPEGTDPTQPDPSEPPAQPVPGVDFDPYRFGAPTHPVAPEYAPPGYVPPPVPPTPSTPAPAASNPWAPPPVSPPVPPPPPQPYYPGYQQHPGYGTQPLQPQPYQPYPGQYPVSGYGQYPQPSSGPGGKAITALCLGIASIVFFWTSVFDLVPIVLALIFGILAINDARRRPRRNEKGMAIAGVACALVGVLFASMFTFWIIRGINNCGGFSSFNESGVSSETDACFNDYFGSNN